MAYFETYQSNAAEVPLMRKWLLRALIVSLLVHAGLLVFFHFKELPNFGYAESARLAPPTRVLKQVKIPDIPDEEVKLTLPEARPMPKITVPDDKPELTEVFVSPSAPETTAPIVQEKPKVKLQGFDSSADMDAASLNALEKQLTRDAGSLVDKSIRSINQPRIRVTPGNKPGDGGPGTSGIPGRDTIDAALARGVGALASKPIAMRGGALFDYGKAELRPEAIIDLQKLGELIKRNPKALFVISGHTDHFGTFESNLALSQERADAVRFWLVSNLGIDPTRITTIGKANTEAFPDLGPEKSEEEQAPNRRVEIVIKTGRK